jgi:aminoglycoside phosphotransferase
VPSLDTTWLERHVPFAGDVGHRADRPDLHGELDGIASAIGVALRQLHEVDPTGSGLPIGWEHLEQRVAANQADLDVGDLPEPYCRYSVELLVELWRQGRPEVEDLVVCHGAPSLGNLRMTAGAVTGMTEWGHACVVDRHFDLAIVQRSLHYDLGPAAVFGFYEGYGADPDLVRLDHFVLASLLIG